MLMQLSEPNPANNFMSKPQPGEKYRHFKSSGGKDYTYEIVAVGKHSETLEDLVIYRTLYETDDFPKGQVWCRPLENFTGDVERENYSGPRFRKIS